MTATRSAGFTLLEILIALAIVAIGLAAALRATGAGIDGTQEYRSHMAAFWLADNLAAEHVARRDWLDPGMRRHDEEMSGQRFLVSEEISQTPNPRFRRMEIKVAGAAEPNRVLRQNVIFLVNPS